MILGWESSLRQEAQRNVLPHIEKEDARHTDMIS